MKTIGFTILGCKNKNVYARKEAESEVIVVNNLEKASEILARYKSSQN